MNKQNCAKITACVALTAMFQNIYTHNNKRDLNNINDTQQNNLKYILLWTKKSVPFKKIGFNQRGFVRRSCTYTNCFVTENRHYFNDYMKFHAVVFDMQQLVKYSSSQFPPYRSPDQKYVFASVESPHYYPVCSSKYDNYFNWTWTYRLDSDCRYEYISIRDEHGNVIGPNQIMHWMKVRDMKPVSRKFRNSLLSKTKAAAWFVSRCTSASDRESFVRKLQNELYKYRLEIDIYGKCGELSCPRKSRQWCFDLIKRDYYFYLAFENSFGVDYVTEKLLTALKNNAIPIVYGEANYTRFMPNGIYLNARTLGVEKLARKMDFLINNPEIYTSYFKWKKHYSYHSRDESGETDDVCAFCKLLNDEQKFRQTSVIQDFQMWWNSTFC